MSKQDESIEMKYLFFIIVTVFIYLRNYKDTQYSLYKDRITFAEQTPDTIHITDHKYFDITFYEAGFNKWLAQQEPMSNFYESSLEIRNMQYVNEWNTRVANPSIYDSHLYSQRIEYKINPRKRYGLEVNYKLYQFFIFFEKKHEQLLLD